MIYTYEGTPLSELTRAELEAALVDVSARFRRILGIEDEELGFVPDTTYPTPPLK